MSVDFLIRSIEEENGRDLNKEVVRIIMNEDYWGRLKDERELGGEVQVGAVGPGEVQFYFRGIPVKFREGIECFSLETASRKTI